MIVKEQRDRSKLGFERYNLRIIDKFDNSFVMLVGDNGDLYWLPEDYKRVKEFCIDKDDTFLFNIFNQLFNAIVKVDNDKYSVKKSIEGNTFTFISERPSVSSSVQWAYNLLTTHTAWRKNGVHENILFLLSIVDLYTTI